MAEQPKSVKIVNTIPAIVADGHGLGINPENDVANLLFIQINVSQDPKVAQAKEAEGSMVANIRLSLEQLTRLQKDINTTLDSYKPKKSK